MYLPYFSSNPVEIKDFETVLALIQTFGNGQRLTNTTDADAASSASLSPCLSVAGFPLELAFSAPFLAPFLFLA